MPLEIQSPPSNCEICGVDAPIRETARLLVGPDGLYCPFCLDQAPASGH